MKKPLRRKTDRPTVDVLLVSIFLAEFFWVADSYMDTFVFKEGSILDNMLNPLPIETWMRFVAMGIIVTVGAVARRQIKKVKRTNEYLEELAATDTLTLAYNRTRFEEIMTVEMDRARRFDHALSMLMLDIDEFKDVNDTFGHDVGDYVLKNIADIVRGNTRRINPFIRLGGDEFVILAIETESEGTKAMAERLKNAVESFPFNEVGKVTVSIGLTQFEKDDTSDTFFKRVDKALYKAKAGGGNRVEVE